MKNTQKRNTWIFILTFTPIFWLGGGWWLARKPKPENQFQTKYPDSLVIVDKGDYGDIRFYHDDISPDTLNYIYDHSQITKTTLKR